MKKYTSGMQNNRIGFSRSTISLAFPSRHLKKLKRNWTTTSQLRIRTKVQWFISTALIAD